MNFLLQPLREDVRKLEYLGMFSQAREIIRKDLTDRRLPEAYRHRLEFELFRMSLLMEDYSLTEKEAFALFRKKFKSVTKREFQSLVASGMIDWRWIDGERRFEKRFDSNLAFKYKEYAQRMKPDRERIRRMKTVNKAISRLLKTKKPKSYRIVARITLWKRKRIGEKVGVWLPFPKEGFQQYDVKLVASSHPSTIASNKQVQRTVYMEGLDSEEFWVEFEYKITEWVGSKQTLGKSEKPWDSDLQPKPPHIVFSDFLWNMLDLIFSGRDFQQLPPLERARMIYDYITLNVKYSYVLPYALYDNIPEYVATTLSGDCGFQALLFITLCRMVGVPARWQSGWFVLPWNASPHDWALIFTEEYGWVPVDLSFGGARRDDENLRLFYFTNLDGYRMFANTDFQSDFDPPKRKFRLDPYDNQTGEMEYIDDYKEPIIDLEHDIKVLKFEEI
ncbi:transglutaminase-like domain-containing protein [Fervidobacterium thailandense]|uniref:Transglutaminase n=1 Tax=Fervidobacterium thailandense TaxID=1008305 RepID=A0A1E3G563_9BACT|nr:transglutaminase-like domain-containing protein [Fervidobacterium thailandense]ODN31431.1 transglutaminase [Fervidobacterium thailandense]